MKYIDELIERRKNLSSIKNDIEKAYVLLEKTYKEGNKVLICGNGGSASDAAHITGELMKGFKKKRPLDTNILEKLTKVVGEFSKKNNCTCGEKRLEEMKETLETGLPTIDLTAFNSLNTAFSNDKNSDFMYANAVLGLGKKGDTLIAISTSGTSKNIIMAALVAKAKDMNVLVFSGRDGGKLKNAGDANIIVPLDETYLIQEEHIAIYHAICLDLEDNFFNC